MVATAFNAADRLYPTLPARPNTFEQALISAVTAIEPNASFQPLDPDVVSNSIPAFFIGRNKAGFWVARESKGRVGGIFLFKNSAVEFAKAESAPSHCALVFPNESFELDIENRGNLLIAWLAPVIGPLVRRIEASP